MKFSTSVDIALRILVHLAERGNDEALASAPEVSQVLQVSYNNVVRIINRLQSAGIVVTHAGRYGGMELSKPIGKITMRAVSTAIDGPTQLSSCSPQFSGSNKGFAPAHDCEISNCSIRDELLEINQQIDDLLEDVTIAGIIERHALRKAGKLAPVKKPKQSSAPAKKSAGKKASKKK